MKKFCVWVMEIAILSASGKRILYWEVWKTFNTRAEAVAERDKPRAKWVSRRFVEATTRIRKYVPA